MTFDLILLLATAGILRAIWLAIRALDIASDRWMFFSRLLGLSAIFQGAWVGIGIVGLSPIWLIAVVWPVIILYQIKQRKDLFKNGVLHYSQHFWIVKPSPSKVTNWTNLLQTLPGAGIHFSQQVIQDEMDARQDIASQIGEMRRRRAGIDRTTVQRILEAVEDLAVEYRRVPGLILTEADLKFQLMVRLMQVDSLRLPLASADSEVLATAVHSEISWFDEQNHLMLRPDITVTDPVYLSIHRTMQRGVRFPSKGFHFIGNSILIELKFCRQSTGISPRELAKIRDDRDKLRSLIIRARQLAAESNYDCFYQGLIIVFTKYEDLLEGGQELAGIYDENITIIVKSGGNISLENNIPPESD